jgi:hypothetical protein
MRKIVILLFIFPLFGLAQKDSILFKFNEYGVSINYFHLNQDYSYGKTGYGLFAYHSGDENKRINIVYGFEFNHVNFHLDNIWGGRFYNYSDVNITCNSLSFPILIRAGCGNHFRFFIETGLKIDFRIWSNLQAMLYSSAPNSNNQQVYSTSEIDESAHIAGDHPLDCMPSFGLGVSCKLNKISLILKTDYSKGLSYFFKNNPNNDLIYNRYINFSIGLKINQK